MFVDADIGNILFYSYPNLFLLILHNGEVETDDGYFVLAFSLYERDEK